jgi:hypothetical protein
VNRILAVAADRSRSGWAAVRRHPRRAGAASAVVCALAAGALVISQPEEPTVDGAAYQQELVTVNDIPAESFVNWVREPVEVMPALSNPDSSVTTPNQDCLPGGDKQRSVQQMVFAGTRWSGERFVNAGSGQIITVYLSNSPHNDLEKLDGWLTGCADTTLNVRGVDTAMTLRSLPVDPAFYGIDTARVWASTVRPDNGSAASTLTAYGMSGGVTMQVDLTFPAEVSDAAINQLDAVWRAQTAKLVGMQSAGGGAA